jgi:hypothetical protein
LLPGGEAAGEDGDLNRFDVALCDGLPAALFDALAAFGLSLRPRSWKLSTISPLDAAWTKFWGISCAISWTYAFLSSLSADQSLGYCEPLPACRIRADGWASLTATEYGYKEFDAPPVRSLSELISPDDEQQD